MTGFIFALVALLCWSGSDLFSKLSTSQQDKFSHWRVIFAVGAIMGIHAVITLIFGAFLDPETTPEFILTVLYTDFKPMDFVYYLPVAFIYLAAMVIGYVGLRYIELSVSSPICNSSGSLAILICAILGWAVLDGLSVAAVVLITAGIIGLGFTEYFEDEQIKAMRQDKSQFKYTRSLIAIIIPVIYLVMDALGTVGDQLIYELELFEMSDYASNTAFEFTSLCFAIFAFIWVKFVKKQNFFRKRGEDTKRSRALVIGGVCETVGQMFYMAVMFSDFKAGMPMISAYCVVSVLWSRIFLKEKLSWKHYLAIFITILGIILLAVAEMLAE